MAADESDSTAVDVLMTIVRSRPPSPRPGLDGPEAVAAPPPSLGLDPLARAYSPIVSPVLAGYGSGMGALAGSGLARAASAGPYGVPQTPASMQAYAKLEGEDFHYYMTSLSILLGRSALPGEPSRVDVELGPARNISRQHARISYNFETQRFELIVMGKNGVYVDNCHYGPDPEARIPLETKYVAREAQALLGEET